MYQLNVYYDLELRESVLKFRDEEIKEIAGVAIQGSGYNTECAVRDIELHFDTEAEMQAAQSGLRDAGFRFAPLCGLHPG